MEATLTSLLNGYGQINYEKLKDFVSRNSLAEFTSQAPHPFLVGKELYDGELKRKIGGTLSTTSTMKFSVSEIFRDDEAERERLLQTKTRFDSEDSLHGGSVGAGAGGEDITHAVYMLRQKSLPHPKDASFVTIGRNGRNDIVIADRVISNKHANIIIEGGSYYIVDTNSTNGTKVNGARVTPQEKVLLQLNANIAFGRLCFVFAHPLQVYRSIRKEMLGF
jgi:hypothetical protein